MRLFAPVQRFWPRPRYDVLARLRSWRGVPKAAFAAAVGRAGAGCRAIDNPPTVDSLPLVMRGEAWQSRLAQISLKAEFFGDRQVSDGAIDIRSSSSGARLARIVGERQTLLFSATFSDDIIRLTDRWTREPIKVEIEPEIKNAEAVDQKIFLVSTEEKYPLLLHILQNEQVERAMVFANRRDIVRDLAEKLRKDGIDCSVLSGDVPQYKRLKTLDRFKKGQVTILVATDVAGRGIHVDGVSHVVNFTLPEEAEDYVHRIGRTGRAGAKGTSVSFACEDDSFQIPALEEYIGQKIELEDPPASWLDQ